MIHSLTPLTLSALFVAAPLHVLPLLETNARLDLIDLYEAQMTAEITNRYGGKTQMRALSDTLIALQLTPVSSMELRLLPDSTIEVRHAVQTPEITNTKIDSYDTSWHKINPKSTYNTICHSGLPVK